LSSFSSTSLVADVVAANQWGLLVLVSTAARPRPHTAAFTAPLAIFEAGGASGHEARRGELPERRRRGRTPGGLESCHFRAARTSKGWRTPVTADGAGRPDLVLVRPPRIIFAELKSETGELKPRQAEWLDVLRLLPATETYLWRPRDWAELVEILTGTAPKKAA
jgi:hypothetical protein